MTYKKMTLKSKTSHETSSDLFGLPNLLTFFRIGTIPLVVGLFFIETQWADTLAAFLFFIACVTDYLDGYLARTWQQMTKMGRFLDPVADKLLVAASLLMLAGFHRIQGVSLIPAVVILGREILVSGLREFLAEVRVSVPVTALAKWKTFLQMLAIGLLIVGEPFPFPVSFENLGLIGLWIAGALTLLTGYDYLKSSFQHLRQGD